ncbi:isoprenylcysteine carboxylmethyltransferase family protein [Candidatus Bathyarchaeota archaeon]|nr:isoprenylcysteine carboxylmethyltransferase family protein [Candidatus Bathyarchaeota archaeon]
MSQLGKKQGFAIILLVLLFLAGVWVSRFGTNMPQAETYMTLFRADAWFLVFLGVAATIITLIPLLLEFSLSKTTAFISWILYFPVLFNTLIPMFILFFSIIGVFYTPWLIFTDLPVANRLINGVIRLENGNVHLILDYVGYALILLGLAIYLLSLYQLLKHTGRGGKLLTEGLYKIVRHPQYLGIFLWTLGFAITGWRLINYVMWLTLCYSYTLLAIHEEDELEKAFGQEYARYKNRTPIIIPYLKIKPIPKLVSKSAAKILLTTIIYIILLLAFYYFIDPYVIMYR